MVHGGFRHRSYGGARPPSRRPEGADMHMPLGKTIVALAGVLTLAVGGAASAASGHPAASPHHARIPHTHPAKVKSAEMVVEQTSPDTDTVQSGDQTTPDSAANVVSDSQAGGSQSAPSTDEQ